MTEPVTERYRPNGWMPVVIAALLGMVVAGSGFWLALGRETVTRDEVVEIVRTQSPYLQDRGVLTRLESHVTALAINVNVLASQVAALQATIERR